MRFRRGVKWINRGQRTAEAAVGVDQANDLKLGLPVERSGALGPLARGFFFEVARGQLVSEFHSLEEGAERRLGRLGIFEKTVELLFEVARILSRQVSELEAVRQQDALQIRKKP